MQVMKDLKVVNVYIYGARATAAGLYRALSKLNSNKQVKGFIVTDSAGNPATIWDVPVRSLQEISGLLSAEEKLKVEVYIATPQLFHEEIRHLLQKAGFRNLLELTSANEADIMERYYDLEQMFPSIHKLPFPGKEWSCPDISVYVASFFRDKPVGNLPRMPDYMKRLFLGCFLARQSGVNLSKQADFCDDAGDNISFKNPNRCEMTAHYWIWKNRFDTDDEYVGVYHYRRFLDMSDDDLRRMKANDVDVVLPFPMIHYPSALIHHTWYVREDDWQVMRQVLRELQPEYDARFDEIFAQPYFYNYNIMIAKKSVFADYCAWLFPILDTIEERSEPRGKDRADRYTAYMSESLTTLYFMYHQQDLKIYHTGRLLYT